MLEGEQVAGARFIGGARGERVVGGADQRSQLERAGALRRKSKRWKRRVELDLQIVVADGQRAEAHAPRRRRTRAHRGQQRAAEQRARIRDRDHSTIAALRALRTRRPALAAQSRAPRPAGPRSGRR